MRDRRQSPWQNVVFSFSVPILAGALCILVSSLFFAVLTYFVLKTMDFGGTFCAASLGIGGVTSGYICGKYRRRRGLIDGLICGGALYLLLTAAGIAAAEGLPGIWKLPMLLVTGAAGGVWGVNSPRPKKLM